MINIFLRKCDHNVIYLYRDFAFKLDNLKVLKVAACNLKSLDGVWNIPNVEELYAPDNEISDIMLCCTLVKLVVLDVSR